MVEETIRQTENSPPLCCDAARERFDGILVDQMMRNFSSCGHSMVFSASTNFSPASDEVAVDAGLTPVSVAMAPSKRFLTFSVILCDCLSILEYASRPAVMCPPLLLGSLLCGSQTFRRGIPTRRDVQPCRTHPNFPSTRQRVAMNQRFNSRLGGKRIDGNFFAILRVDPENPVGVPPSDGKAWGLWFYSGCQAQPTQCSS